MINDDIGDTSTNPEDRIDMYAIFGHAYQARLGCWILACPFLQVSDSKSDGFLVSEYVQLLERCEKSQ